MEDKKAAATEDAPGKNGSLETKETTSGAEMEVDTEATKEDAGDKDTKTSLDASSKDTSQVEAAVSSKDDPSSIKSAGVGDELKQENGDKDQKTSKEEPASASSETLTGEIDSKGAPAGGVPQKSPSDGAEEQAMEKDGVKNEVANSKESQNDQEKPKEEKAANQENKEKKVIVQRIQVSKENLWVSNVSKDTTAKDLKNLFVKYGKVIAVKIVTSAKSVNSKATFGFVTMETAEQAQKCIKFLNNTELKGNMISVDSVKQEAPLRSRNESIERRRSDELRTSRSAHSSLSRSSAKLPEKRRRSPSPGYRRTPPHLRRRRTPSPFKRRPISPPRRRRTPSPFRRDRYLTSPPRRRSPIPRSRSPVTASLRAREYDTRSPFFDHRSRSPIRGYSPPHYRPSRRSSSPMSRMLTFDMIKEERLREQQRQRISREPDDKLDYLQEHNIKEMQRLEWEREQIRKEKEALERERAHILELEKQKQLEIRLTIEKEKRMLEEKKNKLQQTMTLAGMDGTGSLSSSGYGMPSTAMASSGTYWGPSNPPTPWGPSGPMFGTSVSRPLYGGPMGSLKKP